MNEKFMYEQGLPKACNEWMDDLTLDLTSDSYNIAKFLGIPFDEIHQNLLSLSSTIGQEVKV